MPSTNEAQDITAEGLLQAWQVAHLTNENVPKNSISLLDGVAHRALLACLKHAWQSTGLQGLKVLDCQERQVAGVVVQKYRLTQTLVFFDERVADNPVGELSYEQLKRVIGKTHLSTGGSELLKRNAGEARTSMVVPFYYLTSQQNSALKVLEFEPVIGLAVQEQYLPFALHGKLWHERLQQSDKVYQANTAQLEQRFEERYKVFRTYDQMSEAEKQWVLNTRLAFYLDSMADRALTACYAQAAQILADFDVVLPEGLIEVSRQADRDMKAGMKEHGSFGVQVDPTN